MKNWTIYFILLITSCIIISCDDTISYYEVERNDFVEVNSTLSPSTDVSITIRESDLPSLELKPINNANVFITDLTANEEMELMNIDPGIYTLNNFRPFTGNSYDLKVIIDNVVITANTVIPDKPEIRSFLYALTPNQFFYEVSFELENTPGVDQYFYVESISEYVTDNFSSQTTNVILLPSQLNEYLLDYLNPPGDRFSFDRLYIHLPANELEQYVNISFTVEENPGATIMGNDTLLLDQTISLRALSQELFEYESSRIQSQSIPFTAESEPLPIQSNVSQAEGIFGGSNETTLVLVR